MDQETKDTQTPLFEESHPWIALMANAGEEDSVDEVIRFTLDELRFA
jgi:hypothetical protein